MADDEQLLRDIYRAFNERDIDAAVALMHPDVDWPNAWEGGRVRGQAAVRDYWTRQFQAIDSRVEPEDFETDAQGRIVVGVHAVVRDAGAGDLLSDGRVHHCYTIRDGLIERMDVEEEPVGT